MNRHALRLLALLPSAALLIAGCGTEPKYFATLPSESPDASEDSSAASDSGTDEGSDVSADTAEDSDDETPDAMTADVGGSDTTVDDDTADDDAASDSGVVDALFDGDNADNEAPIARVTCRVEGRPQAPTTGLRVQPLESVICSAAGSTDADGDIIDYQWAVVSWPVGSTVRPQPSDAAETRLFLDMSGSFTLQVVVTDERGAVSAPATASIVAAPFQDIHVQLTWRAANGEELPGGGTDLDLHLLHQNGCWKDAHWDCHYSNTRPNWGDPYSTDDDPSIDMDGMSGIENVMLDNPETGVRYTVGVHYYDDHDMGDAYATVQVFMFGELVYEVTDRLMQSLGARDGQWWEVASIDWPSATVTAIDSITSAPPECEVPAP